jgi:hypothetical protein
MKLKEDQRRLLPIAVLVALTLSLGVIQYIAYSQDLYEFLPKPAAAQEEFFLDETSQVLIRPYTNAHGHVYPYTATALTLTCIVMVLVIIIVCAPNL